MRCIPILAGAILILGCSSFGKHTAGIAKIRIDDKEINLGGDLTFKKLTILEEALRALPPEVVKSVNHISFSEDADHFPYSQQAHAFFDTICIHRVIDPGVIWHEVAHTYTYALGYEFLDQWKKIVGDVYQDFRYGFYREAYKEKLAAGVVSAYGLMNEKEDIAEWVQEIYEFTHGTGSIFKNPERIDKADPRFSQKLELLYKSGFFNQDVYEKIKPLLE